MKILVLGGAGYIGSHTVKALNNNRHETVVYDDLSSGHKEAVPGSKIIVGSICDSRLLSSVIKDEKVEAVMHFAAKIEVAESMDTPSEYIKANCFDGINVITSMLENNVKNLIFSSTAAVYGNPKEIPITEDCITKPTNPYGLSKLMFEQIMEYFKNEGGLNYISLRYFNAAGADVNGLLGDDHLNKTHLIASAILTSLGIRDKFFLFGTDYDTPDGTCIRDYIHVDDLASAHVLALEYLIKTGKSDIFNLGSENGYSNKEIIKIVKEISEIDFKVEETDRRLGDSVVLTASSEKAMNILGWKPKYSDLNTIVKTAYRWHKSHPNGYAHETPPSHR